MWETWVPSLVWEDVLPWWLSCKESTSKVGDTSLIPEPGRYAGKEMATHSSVLAWKIPWTEELGGAAVHGAARVRYDFVTDPSTSYLVFTECSTVAPRCHQGLVPGPTVDTKICECSSPKVSICICGFGQLAIFNLIVFCPPLMTSSETALPSAQHSWLLQDIHSRL